MRHLIALAETSNFTSAARQCHISQPPFSRSIRRLEAAIGKPLVSRERGRAVLTPAGAAFVGKAREALALVDEAVRFAQRTTGSVGRLRIGLNEYVYALLAPIGLQDFARRHPGLVIEPVDRPELPAGLPLLERRIDMCFEVTGSPETVTWQDGLNYALIYREPLAAAVSMQSPLAAQETVALSDLTHHALAVFNRDSAPQMYDDMVRVLEANDVLVQVGIEVSLLATMLDTVRVNSFVGLVPESVGLHAVPGVRILPLTGPEVPKVHLYLSWRRSDASTLTRDFLDWSLRHCRLLPEEA